jgi:hypothetical protein
VSDGQTGYPPLSQLASEVAGIEECTSQIGASAEAIASIFVNDPDGGLMILGRVRGALEVAMFWLMREESEAKGETEP